MSEILIIGGGIIGLAIGIELKLKGIDVSILTRNTQETATRAAAGMLAPQAEQIPPSPMLDLCLKSRDLYRDWTYKLERITGLKTGYWPCGILSPFYQTDNVNFTQTKYAEWLDEKSIHTQQSGLSPELIGGWWYSLDGQVDNRSLYQTLLATAQLLKIDLKEGIFVKTMCDRNQHKIVSIETSIGALEAQHYVLATGAWSQDLLPIPVYPKKGEMLSIRVKPEPKSYDELPLKTVLFGQEIYIVPRQDGRIVLGATSANVGFTEGNTPGGIQQLLQGAIRLFPGLKDYPIEEFWWGFRPATPDELPILGPSGYDNLTLATGHYRNGILLAPVTALLITDWILGRKADPLLSSFHYGRFSYSNI